MSYSDHINIWCFDHDIKSGKGKSWEREIHVCRLFPFL